MTSTAIAWRLRAALSALRDPQARSRFLASLTGREAAFLGRDWLTEAHDAQLPPRAAWATWLMLGGRGAGKTRAGAEWVRGLALGIGPAADRPTGRIALVGQTWHDVRAVMVEGVSGLIAVHRAGERPVFEVSRRRLVWPNGAVAELFSAEEPDSLRGPQFDAAWCDELAKWRYPQAAWDMLQFALRLGTAPRQLVTTTPRPLPLLRRLAAAGAAATSRIATRANAHNLAPAFLDRVVAAYAGTRLGRQELDGEIVEEREDALFQRALIERTRVASAPELARIVVAVDPPASSGARADACGIVAAGLGGDGRCYVLADASAPGLTPAGWGRRAVALFRRLAADRIVVEVNQGGEMAGAVLRQIDPAVPVSAVRASRGKFARAEPVAALYEQGRVAHVGAFPALEDEMCDFGPDGLSGGRSPDRLDALVWALSALMHGAGRSGPRVRAL